MNAVYFTVCYSGSSVNNTLAPGFLVNNKYNDKAIISKLVYDSLCVLSTIKLAMRLGQYGLTDSSCKYT